MIEFYVSGQTLKFFTPVIAADSLNYLTAKVNFTDAQWDGYSKWLHFRQDEELGAVTYDMQLNENDEITADRNLSLTVGQWEIYLTGTLDDSRLTTVPVILTVKESGLIDAPLHELPLSVAEQVDFNARQAVLLAQAVKAMADRGQFNGKDGASFYIAAYYDSFETLSSTVSEPEPGAFYGVGAEAPYEMYVWDSKNLEWVNNGYIQGAPGEQGGQGTTFIPSVDANGNLSWTNDGGLENPDVRNIMGPKGDTGATGADGPGAFEKAQEAGYTGTEATFYQALTAMPYHNARHLPNGADPITVEAGNIAAGVVTRAKLASDALHSPVIRLYSGVANRDLTADDDGKTIMTMTNTVDFTVNLSADASANMPEGFEIAVCFYYGQSLQISIESGIYVAHSEFGKTKAGITFSIPKQNTMIALKKVLTYGGYSYWLVTGNVEVVE